MTKTVVTYPTEDALRIAAGRERGDPKQPEYRRPRTAKRGGLYVTDAELIERLGVPEKIAREALHELDHSRTAHFPKKQALWGNRRYWPAVEAWLDKTGGIPQERKSA